MKIWVSDKGRELEENQALCDAAMVVRERGAPIDLALRGKANIKRDRYNSVSRQSAVATKTLYAFPIITSPTTYQMEKAGITQKSSIIVYIATYNLRAIGINSLKEIDELISTVTVNGAKHLITDKNEVSQFHNSYLYNTLGLYEK